MKFAGFELVNAQHLGSRVLEILGRFLYSNFMSELNITLSVTEASAIGVSGIIKALDGHECPVILERHGKPVAKLISIEEADALDDLEEDLRLAALALSRSVPPPVSNVSLRDLAEEFGFDFDELVTEVEAEMKHEK